MKHLHQSGTAGRITLDALTQRVTSFWLLTMSRRKLVANSVVLKSRAPLRLEKVDYLDLLEPNSNSSHWELLV